MIYDKAYFESGGDASNYHGYIDGEDFKEKAKKIITILNLKKGDKVLEVGCAKGFIVNHLVDTEIDAYGMDISDYAIGESYPKNRFMVGDLLTIPYPDSFFDAIYSFDTLEHLFEAEVNPAIEELCRVALKQYHSITTSDHLIGGDNTHHCIKSIDWWREQFPKRGSIIIQYTGQ
jgi:SAM-dependent methyltransferase